MSQRNTLIRSLHDIGLATWFGGSLMGVVGLNGATAQAEKPAERLKLSSIGWARWAPVQLAALGAHAIGGVGLILSNRSRLAVQGEGRTNTVVKLVITLAAAGVTLWSALVGRKIAAHAEEGAKGVTEPGASSSEELRSAQAQQKVLQWIIPASTLVLIVLGAQQGEQQRDVAGRLGR